MRVVNFLDYHDLFDYNFQPPFPPEDEERPPIATKEAIRLIKLKLKVSRVEKAGEHSDPESHPDHPIVHFVGTSYSVLHHFDINGNSKIRGELLAISSFPESILIRVYMYLFVHPQYLSLFTDLLFLSIHLSAQFQLQSQI